MTDKPTNLKAPARDLWYLVYCRPRQELRAQQHLANQGFDTFLPRFCAGTAAGHSNKDLLFPRYVFIKPKHDHAVAWSAIRSTRGAIGLVRFGLQVATVRHAIIEQINQLQLNHTPEPAFEAGDEVVIDAGIYQGVRAIYQCADGDKRSVLLIGLLQHQVPIVLDNQEFIKAS